MKRPRFIIVYACPDCGWWTCSPAADGRCGNRPAHDPPIEFGKTYDVSKFPLLVRHRYEPVEAAAGGGGGHVNPIERAKARAGEAYERAWDAGRHNDAPATEDVVEAVMEALGVERAVALLSQALANNPIKRELILDAYAALTALD